jgi:hypothetical protein
MAFKSHYEDDFGPLPASTSTYDRHSSMQSIHKYRDVNIIEGGFDANTKKRECREACIELSNMGDSTLYAAVLASGSSPRHRALVGVVGLAHVGLPSPKQAGSGGSSRLHGIGGRTSCIPATYRSNEYDPHSGVGKSAVTFTDLNDPGNQGAHMGISQSTRFGTNSSTSSRHESALEV